MGEARGVDCGGEGGVGKGGGRERRRNRWGRGGIVKKEEMEETGGEER